MPSLPSISAASVRNAVARVHRDGVPKGRGSTKFCLVLDGSHFPPKYVLALAARDQLGRDLRPDEFSGGPQTNAVLTDLGFTISACSCGGTLRRSQPTPTRVAPIQPAPATSPTVVRVVCEGQTPHDPSSEEGLLHDVFTARWPRELRSKFVVTPGGFVRGAFPTKWSGTCGWDSSPEDFAALTLVAERQLRGVVSARVLDAARGKMDVLTIGIDLVDSRRAEHAELVAVYDVKARRLVRWTGKSYPTSNQERTLVHCTDLSTHLLEIAQERVLVLGCHDLNMFSPRGHANQSPDGTRRLRCNDMRELAASFRPTIVLQHPHSTDTPNIWRMPWMSLARELPTVRAWASGVAYFSRNGAPRAPLARVLELTKADASVVDIVVRSNAYA